jgi:NAD(P)-dependent dehydrogenase (short-subunit alcohol dehydrogenase family)
MSIHPAIQPGNVAVLTGGANGIGLAAAKRLAALGMKLAVADKDQAQLALAAAELGDAAIAVETDVADRASVEALARTVADRCGPVSVLMNNAGHGGGGDALSSYDGWTRVLGTNLFGVLHGVQAFVPAMVDSDRPGLVINTGSKQGITQPPGDTAYNVSKSGVKALTEGLAHTLREKTGGRVTAHLLVPGFTYTGIMAKHFAEQPAAAWTPDQVAETMLDGIARGAFYLWCLDNETSREQDAKRVLWHAQDIVEDRPALSRWHPDYRDAFAGFMEGEAGGVPPPYQGRGLGGG